MIDTRYFTDALMNRRMSQRGLAKAIGLDPGALSLTLRGKRKMTAQEARQIAHALRLDEGEVLRRSTGDKIVTGVTISVVKLPVVISTGIVTVELPVPIKSADLDVILTAIQAFCSKNGA